MSMHVVISGDVIERSLQALQDCLSLLPILRVFSNVAGENDSVDVARVDQLDGFAQVLCACGVRFSPKCVSLICAIVTCALQVIGNTNIAQKKQAVSF